MVCETSGCGLQRNPLHQDEIQIGHNTRYRTWRAGTRRSGWGAQAGFSTATRQRQTKTHADLPTTLRAAKGPAPTYATDGRAAGQAGLTDRSYTAPGPARRRRPPPPPQPEHIGRPWGRRSNEFISGRWQGASTREFNRNSRPRRSE